MIGKTDKLVCKTTENWGRKASYPGNGWYSVREKSSRKLEAPREETVKKMRPVKREEFTALVQKAIHTPSKKPLARAKAAGEPAGGA